MQWQRANSTVDVHIPREAPPDHLHIVDAHNLLEEVVAFLIVYIEEIFIL